MILLTQGLWATTVYRVCHAVETRMPKGPGRTLLRVFLLFLQKAVEIGTSIRIPGACIVGRGLYIGHFGPIILHPDARIGDYCNLSQGVTIGRTHGSGGGAPVIGDRVYIGPNSVVIGPIVIGHDVAIGAGSVVTKSLPERAVAAGNPARVLSLKGSFEQVSYQGMLTDPARIAAIEAARHEAIE